MLEAKSFCMKSFLKVETLHWADMDLETTCLRKDMIVWVVVADLKIHQVVSKCVITLGFHRGVEEIHRLKQDQS
jgi:hypothetical protein